MPQIADLMAAGMQWPLAQGLGNTALTTSAAGTTAAAATTLPPQNNVILLTCAATGSQAAIFSKSAPLGTPVYVAVLATAAVTASVFCPVSGTMNGTLNGSVALATGKSAIFIQSTASTWYSIPLAP